MTVITMSRPEREVPADEQAALVTGAEERAFRTLVIANAPHLQRVLRSLGVPEADLDDICQETFIVAHRRLATFEGRSSLRTWLCGIALHIASDYRDKAYRRRELPSQAPPAPALEAQQERALERKQAWQLIETLLATLSKEQREVFVLYEIAELSMPDAARALGCPLQTAYSRLNAAREQVERRMVALRAKERVR